MPKPKIIKWHLYVTPVEEKFIDKLFGEGKSIDVDGSSEFRVGIPYDKDEEEVYFSKWAGKDKDLAASSMSVYERLLKAGMIQVIKNIAPNGNLTHRIVDFDRWQLITIKKRPRRFTQPGLLKLTHYFQKHAMSNIVSSVTKFCRDRNSLQRFDVKPATFNRTITGKASAAGCCEIYPLKRDVKKGIVWVVIAGFEQYEMVPTKSSNNKKKATTKTNDPAKKQGGEATKKGADAQKHTPKKPHRGSTPPPPDEKVSNDDAPPEQPIIGNATEKRYYTLVAEVAELEQALALKQLEVEKLGAGLKDAWKAEKKELKARMALLDARLKNS